MRSRALQLAGPLGVFGVAAVAVLAGRSPASSAPMAAAATSGAPSVAVSASPAAVSAPPREESVPRPAASAEPTSGPVERKGCVDAARDALARYRRRTEEPGLEAEARLETIGDLDGDGSRDVAVTFLESCGNHVGCQPYYLYLRSSPPGARCDRFVGASDGDEPRLLESAHHGLRDLRVTLPGLYGESESRLAFDGVRYLKVAERERDRPDVGRPWGPWSKWSTLARGVSAEEE